MNEGIVTDHRYVCTHTHILLKQKNIRQVLNGRLGAFLPCPCRVVYVRHSSKSGMNQVTGANRS